MINKIVFTIDPVGLDQPHAGGGCLLPKNFPWPKDKNGVSLLHLLTIPVNWLIESQGGWLSVFTPFDSQDPYLHWEDLTAEGENQSVVLFHDNDGESRDEFSRPISPARNIFINNINEDDSARNFGSKVYGTPAWLQDVEKIVGHDCLFAINGDDFDVAFNEEPGIFSDGVVYVFLRNGFQFGSRPSVQGKITFQFT